MDGHTKLQLSLTTSSKVVVMLFKYPFVAEYRGTELIVGGGGTVRINHIQLDQLAYIQVSSYTIYYMTAIICTFQYCCNRCRATSIAHNDFTRHSINSKIANIPDRYIVACCLIAPCSEWTCSTVYADDTVVESQTVILY